MGTIAITGSASGIGAATRELMESRSADVIGIDIRDAEIEADLGTSEAVSYTHLTLPTKA